MSSTLTNLIYHIVFSTKNREPYMVSDVRDELYTYMGGIVRSKGGILLEIGGVADHVHILMKQRQDIAVSDMVRLIKVNSSKWLNEKPGFRENRFAWQSGYGAFSVSVSQAESVRRYIQKQEEHHQIRGFQAEYVDFLDKHGIEYDERYVWG